MDDKQAGESRSFPKGLSFIGTGQDSNTSVIDVRHGKIVRIRPLHYDWKYDPAGYGPWKMEARGQTFEPSPKTLIPPYTLAYKKRVYSPNRVLYPMKRVDWDPRGERNPQNRGKSTYERISWDEALDLITAEILRVKDQYGPYAIMSQSDGHAETKIVHSAHGCNRWLLNLLGGFTLSCRNPDSWEGWVWGAKHVWGMEPVGQQAPQTNLMLDISRNAEMVLFWGCDPETTPWGWQGQMSSRLCYWWGELGIKQVYICPDLNYGAAVHADTWIPIKPYTDAALQLAIAYVWISAGTYDHEYVATHTYGFEEFKRYVLGEEDGVPKTPEWAAEKTGVTSRVIKALAREWASKRTTIAHGNGGSFIRGPYSTEPARLEVILLAMQGLGKPGANQVKMIEWGRLSDQAQYPMPRASVIPNVTAADRGQKRYDFAVGVPKQIIAKDLLHEAILNPPVSWYSTTLSKEPVEDQFVKYTYPAEGCSEVHMIWSDTPSWITCWNDGNHYIDALRSPKIEFIMLQHPWLENDCQMADLILPVSTKLEQEDIAVDAFSGQYHLIMRERQCIEPLGESRSDYEIVCAVAEKLGLLAEYTGGKSPEEWMRHGFDRSGAQDMVTWEELNDKHYFVIPTDPKWEEYRAGLIDFYEDPEGHPLKTPSGKLEFSSQNLAKHFPDDAERPPVPHWIESGPSHDERVSSERARLYPLLMVSNHPRWRVHSQHDDITWLREIQTCKIKGPDGYPYEPVWIHTEDAAARGIKTGDVVRVHNERGAVLGGAYVTERIMPGSTYCDHGARYDPIVPGELDRGGAINTISPRNLTSKNATGMATSGFLVEVALADLDELRRHYLEAFGRPFDGGAGLIRERLFGAGQ